MDRDEWMRRWRNLTEEQRVKFFNDIEYLMSDDWERDCLALFTDDQLLAAWRQDDCPDCQQSLRDYGMLPTECPTCSTVRTSDSIIFQVIKERGLEKKGWS